jgi:hypothetical protein
MAMTIINPLSDIGGKVSRGGANKGGEWAFCGARSFCMEGSLVKRHTNNCPNSFRHTGMFLAGIQAVLMDSGWKNAGMTSRGYGHFIQWLCT